MQCPICRSPLQGEKFCPQCGQAITYEGIQPEHYSTPMQSMIPLEIKKWNWGAFSLNAVWGIGNKTYLPLLCFIPYFNFIWMFVCGVKGNEWAWKSNNYQPEQLQRFLTIQSTWNRAGIAKFVIGVVSFATSILLNIFFAALLSELMYYFY